jgi:hypothetical protein
MICKEEYQSQSMPLCQMTQAFFQDISDKWAYLSSKSSWGRQGPPNPAMTL